MKRTIRFVAVATGSMLGTAVLVGGLPQESGGFEETTASVRRAVEFVEQEADVREVDRLFAQLLKTNLELIELNRHGIMLTEAKLCDVVRDQNTNFATLTDDDRLYRLAAEQRTLCRQLHNRAAEFRGSRSFIQLYNPTSN